MDVCFLRSEVGNVESIIPYFKDNLELIIEVFGISAKVRVFGSTLYIIVFPVFGSWS